MSQSVERALVLIEELAGGPKRLGDLAEVLGTHKSTVLGTLQTLEKHGWARREGEIPVFRLGLRVVELSGSVLEDLDIRKVARAQLARLGSARRPARPCIWASWTAAVSLSVPTSRLSTKKLREHVPLLLDATRQISEGLGGTPEVILELTESSGP